MILLVNVRTKMSDKKTMDELDRTAQKAGLNVHMGKTRQMFTDAWNAKATEVHETAKAKGWWDKERNDGEVIALIHSELSEALEALRHGNGPDSHIPEFCGTEAELADVVIRIMDYAKAKEWRIAEAIEAKIAYNNNREKMHGGKTF